jgi:hypothetical protein
MSRNFDNRKRAFADAVTVEAWHDDFGDGKSRVDLHADVVFGMARVGGEADSPVRFRLSIKRAEVVVIIPDTEPVSVDKRSVSRDSPQLEGRVTKTIERKVKARAKAKLSGSISPIHLIGSASGTADAEAGLSSSDKLSMSGAARLMLVTQSQTEEGYYRWIVTPRTKSFLDGRPWDPIKEPRLKLIDRRKDRKKSIPPTVRVEIRCRREDLLIVDLKLKDGGLWQSLKGKTGFRNKLAAAESYIRDRLSEEGLEVKNISDIFGQVTLASTTAESN